jgi:hypothetical protein
MTAKSRIFSGIAGFALYIFVLFREAESLDVSFKPLNVYAFKKIATTDELQELITSKGGIISGVYLKPKHFPLFVEEEVRNVILNHKQFDHETKLEGIAHIKDVAKILMPKDLVSIRGLAEDISHMIEIMRPAASARDKITCRMQLLHGIRCPKWHEDYVKLRLIKTYSGVGTEWVDPSNTFIRATNAVRSYLDKDLIVGDKSKIHRADAGDILVLSGRKREIEVDGGRTFRPIPVLHRSPPVGPDDKRLLFTVTINDK